MPLYMDIHGHIEGLTADVVVQDREGDLQAQEKYGITCLRYWFDDWLLMLLLKTKKDHR